MNPLRNLRAFIQLSLICSACGVLEPAAAFSAPPTGVVLTDPANGTTISSADFFRWSASEGATWYYIWISRNGSKYLDAWVQGTTVYVPDKMLSGGNYTWWIRPWNSDGFGLWSAGASFAIPLNIPGSINTISPTGAVNPGTSQQYVWEPDAAANWYELYISRNGKVFSDTWYNVTNLAALENGDLAASVYRHHGGTYQWWVRGWSPDGMGPWSSTMTCEIPSYSPGAVTMVSPLGGQYMYNPVFSWTAVSNASWYEIYIRKDGAYCYSTWLQGTNWQASWDISADFGNYEWSVIAWNADGLGTWSTATFRGGPYPPGAVTDLHYSNWNGKTCTFVWTQSIPEATAFYVELWKNGEVVLGQWTQATSCQSPQLWQSGSYSWRVMTRNEAGDGPWAWGPSFYIYGF
jgi:hypothetical protein